jgi:hypothetical protein
VADSNGRPLDASDQNKVQMLGMSMGINIQDPNADIIDKITPEHIEMMIKASVEDDKAKNSERKRGQILNLAYLGIGLAFVSFLVVFLRSDQNLMLQVISLVVSFIGGMGAGISLSKRK